MLCSGAVDSPDNSLELAEIRQSFEQARMAWPDIELAFASFAARFDPHGPPGHPHATDFYLACACSEGSGPALAELDRLLLTCVPEAVSRIDRSHDFVTEVQQILRERLLVGDTAKIREYRGRGPLASWLRTAAVRTALNLRRRAGQEGARHAQLAAFDPLFDDPDLALLRQRYMPEIDAALRGAIGALDAKDRLLLSYYYVDGLTMAKIAGLERVGTSTVFRRLNAATQAVLAAMKAELTERLQISMPSLDSLIRHVQDDIDLSLSQVLGKAS